MEKGCLGEGQVRSNGKFLAPPPPVLFNALVSSSLLSPWIWGKKADSHTLQ